MDKQKEILEYLSKVEQATSKEIFNNVEFSKFYYHNGMKHLGAMLSRMVKSGKINRIKRGVFEINKVVKNENRSQTNTGLFRNNV